MSSTATTADDVLDWLNAPDDRPWPPPSKEKLEKIVEAVDDSDNDDDDDEEQDEQHKAQTEEKSKNNNNTLKNANTSSSTAIKVQEDDDDDDDVDHSNTYNNTCNNDNNNQPEQDHDQQVQFNSKQIQMMQQVNMVATFSALIQLSEAEERNEILTAESDDRSDLVSFLMLRVFLYVRDKEQGIVHENNRKLIANDLISELVAANQSMRGELGQIVSAVQQQQQMFAIAQQGQGSASSGGNKKGGGAKPSLIKETF